MLGDQRFIGGNHALARLQRPLGKFPGDLNAADGLNDDIHLRVILNDRKIVDHTVRIGTVGQVTHIQDIFQIKTLARLFGNVLLIVHQHLAHAGTDDTKSHYSYLSHCLLPPQLHPENGSAYPAKISQRSTPSTFSARASSSSIETARAEVSAPIVTAAQPPVGMV